jgi:hypothetical protein
MWRHYPPLLKFLSYFSPNALADAMRLVSAFKVEEDLQRTWREEREREFKADPEPHFGDGK